MKAIKQAVLSTCVLLMITGQTALGSDGQCALTIKLVDAETGDMLPGLVRVETLLGEPVDLQGLFKRGQGWGDDWRMHRWRVLPGPTTVQVPRAKLTITAIYGLETEISRVEVDTTGKDELEAIVRLKRFSRLNRQGIYAANTHLHLKLMSRAKADRYLMEIPRVDGLDVVYLSYLERIENGKPVDITSNYYTLEDLAAMSNAGVLFDFGEEHRHNFTRYGAGYGHVLLLAIDELIHPVSFGAGIMQWGTDGMTLQQGIRKAREQGATVIWCHNDFGLEDIPNWLAGMLDAQNIYDGANEGSYEDTFYHYLNIGLKVPFSTGTDWAIYDFNRVYVQLPRRKTLTSQRLLDELAKGRSFISNGPLLSFSVDGAALGDTVELDGPCVVNVKGKAVGRSDFGTIELIRNGQVIGSAASKSAGGHYAADMVMKVAMDQPGWLALRTPAQPLRDPADGPIGRKNVYGKNLFSHTSAIYVTVAGEAVFVKSSAEVLLAKVKEELAEIMDRGVFENEQEQATVKAVYQMAIERLLHKMESHPH